MLGQEVSAWLAYTILFCLFSIALFIHSIYHWHIIPFTLYAICIASGSLFVVLTPSFSDPNKPWRDQEPILNQLPAYSIFIFAGIIDWQFVYVRFVETAIKNYRRWGSLHPVIISEKGDATGGNISNNNNSSLTKFGSTHLDSIYSLSAASESSFLFSYGSFWIYISALIIHAIVILAFLICKIVITDPDIGALTSAIFITIMTIPSILNTMVVVYTSSRCHSKLISRIMGQNGRDTAILFLIPILFTIVMTSTTVFAWIAYTRPNPMIKPFEGDLVKWILAKSFSVYFPLTVLLLCCLFKKREYESLVKNDNGVKYSVKKNVDPSPNSRFNNSNDNIRVFVKP